MVRAREVLEVRSNVPDKEVLEVRLSVEHKMLMLLVMMVVVAVR